MRNLIAEDIPLTKEGGFKGFGALGFEGTTPSAAGALGIFATAVSAVIGIMTLVAFIWFTFQFLIGAIRIMGSGGDKGALEAAKKQITSGIIGLVVVIAAVFVVSLLGYILGIPNPLNPFSLVKGIVSDFGISI